jgi:hypothetical protein
MIVALLPAASSMDAQVSKFIEQYFAMYPTRATQAGRADFNTRLEDLAPEKIQAWLESLDGIDQEARSIQPANRDERLDRDVVRHQIAWQRFELQTRSAPARNSMFWTGIASEAAIYLVLREDQPMNCAFALWRLARS